MLYNSDGVASYWRVDPLLAEPKNSFPMNDIDRVSALSIDWSSSILEWKGEQSEINKSGIGTKKSQFLRDDRGLNVEQ